MPAQRGQAASPKAGDFTAMQKQKLEKERDDQRAIDDAEAVAAEKAAAEAKEREVIDYFKGAGKPLPEPEKPAEDTSPSRVVRMKYGIDQMAYGREVVAPDEYDPVTGEWLKPAVLGGIRYYDFEEGRQYELPTEMAKYLDDKGYVFH